MKKKEFNEKPKNLEKNLEEDRRYIKIRDGLLKEKIDQFLRKKKVEKEEDLEKKDLSQLKEILKNFSNFGELIKENGEEKIFSLKDKTREIFEEKYPDDYQYYWKNGVYENFEERDPVILKLKMNIIQKTEKDIRVKRVENTENYDRAWNKVYKEIMWNEYIRFVREFPKKAEAYSEKSLLIEYAIKFSKG